jgi:predicted AlkP superfamily pyrophosphatase or phosphodiesterase
MIKITSRLTILLLTLLWICSSVANAQGKKLMTPEQPKLIVLLSVSQFRHDYISRYWDKFSDKGFRKLVNRGTYCKNTSYNYLISDKGVGTSTIVTGAQPASHGIVAASWYSDLKGQIIPAIYDEKANTVGGPFEAGKCSPHQLLSSTFSDEINLSNNFKSKVIGVSLEPASAVLSAGHTADAAYWFDIQNGNFISSSYYMDSLPGWVEEFNAKALPDSYMEQDWNLLLPLSEYSESLPDNNAYESGYDNDIDFPYDISDIAKIYNKKERYSILNTIPSGNNLVKDFAIHAIVNDSLGYDKDTDVLFINFTATEQIGHLFGPLSVEMEDAVLRLDKEIAHFLEFIESYVGTENTLVLFTAEHGLPYSPEYLTDHKIPSGYFTSLSAVSLLKSYLNNVYGKGDWIKEYHTQQIYLNRSLIESADLKLSDFQNDIANLMLQFHGVHNTLTAHSLQNTDYSHGAFHKIQNGYNQKRSGDVIIHLKHGWIEKHGREIVSYGTDTRIPLIWYGWKIKRKTIISPVDLIDIAPTISVLLDISYPNASTGVPIEEIIQ